MHVLKEARLIEAVVDGLSEGVGDWGWGGEGGGEGSEEEGEGVGELHGCWGCLEWKAVGLWNGNADLGVEWYEGMEGRPAPRMYV